MSAATFRSALSTHSLSDAFTAYWTNFANSSDPNVGPASTPMGWPAYEISSPDKQINLQIELPFTVTADLLGAQCDAWDTFYYTLHGGGQRNAHGRTSLLAADDPRRTAL